MYADDGNGTFANSASFETRPRLARTVRVLLWFVVACVGWIVGGSVLEVPLVRRLRRTARLGSTVQSKSPASRRSSVNTDTSVPTRRGDRPGRANTSALSFSVATSACFRP